jgi:hypothetical protein
MKIYLGGEILLHHYWPRHQMEMSGQLPAPAALPPGKSSLYPLDGKLVGHRSRSGRCREEKNKNSSDMNFSTSLIFEELGMNNSPQDTWLMRLSVCHAYILLHDMPLLVEFYFILVSFWDFSILISQKVKSFRQLLILKYVLFEIPKLLWEALINRCFSFVELRFSNTLGYVVLNVRVISKT